jgi:putative integral membrane protein (TIGR02587 family)
MTVRSAPQGRQKVAGTSGKARAGSGSRQDGNGRFAIGLARACGGAILFSLPLLMTMEMWWLGFYMNSSRFAILLLVLIPLLIGLSHFAGFEETHSHIDDVLDAFVAYAVGFVTAGAMLLLFGVLESGMTVRDIVGKLSLQVVPGSIGALLAQSQLGGKKAEEREQENGPTYGGEIFLMAVGALFLGLSVAPTEEIFLIGYMMTSWQAVALVCLSLLGMHAFVYGVEFHGQHQLPEDSSHAKAFLHFTVVGYAIALLMSAYLLWTFGRIEGLVLEEIVKVTIVLGFPAAIGAAAARLIL